MPKRPKVDAHQRDFDFEARDRDAAWLSALPKREERRNKLLGAILSDGKDDHGKRVCAATLRLVLLGINSFGDVCWASTGQIGARCGDPNWAKLIPNGRTLSDRTVKSAIQALYRMSPELLDRADKGKRTERRRILWQYVRSRKMGELVPAMGELVPAMGELVPAMGELSSPQSKKEKPRKGNPEKEPGDEDADGALDLFLEEALEKFDRLAAVVVCDRADNLDLVAKVALLWQAGQLADDHAEQIIESFRAKRDAGDPVAASGGWLWACLESRLGRDELCRLLGDTVPRSRVERILRRRAPATKGR